MHAKVKIALEAEHEVDRDSVACECWQPKALIGDLRSMSGRSVPAVDVVPGVPAIEKDSTRMSWHPEHPELRHIR